MKMIATQLLFMASLFSFFKGNAQQVSFKDKAKIYLVRHAEKDTGRDPGLSEKGMQRAKLLAEALKDKGIKKIYETQFKRTQQTGSILHKEQKIDTVLYDAMDSSNADLFEKIMANKDNGRTILIIGHTNTLPNIIDKLGIHQPIILIDETEYDNLFLVEFNNGKASLQRMKYGQLL